MGRGEGRQLHGCGSRTAQFIHGKGQFWLFSESAGSLQPSAQSSSGHPCCPPCPPQATAATNLLPVSGDCLAWSIKWTHETHVLLWPVSFISRISSRSSVWWRVVAGGVCAASCKLEPAAAPATPRLSILFGAAMTGVLGASGRRLCSDAWAGVAEVRSLCPTVTAPLGLPAATCVGSSSSWASMVIL